MAPLEVSFHPVKLRVVVQLRPPVAVEKEAPALAVIVRVPEVGHTVPRVGQLHLT